MDMPPPHPGFAPGGDADGRPPFPPPPRRLAPGEGPGGDMPDGPGAGPDQASRERKPNMPGGPRPFVPRPPRLIVLERVDTQAFDEAWFSPLRHMGE